MNATKVMAPMIFMIVLATLSVVGGSVAGAVVEGDVNTQFGDQRLEEACNELGVEWEYRGVVKIDGEDVNPGLLDLPQLVHRKQPVVAENVTIRCHLSQGFLSSTTEQVTVNASGVST